MQPNSSSDTMSETSVNNDKAEDGEKELTELDKYWQAVKENPADFTGWTYLLQYVEQENNLTAAREAFNAFLENYPYCYGYWKKYADLEKKLTSVEMAQEVFERGLKAIPLSVDLWIHYINFLKTHHKEDPDCNKLLKNIFERSLKATGQEFRSDRLWDLYISWEQENSNLAEVTALYDRLLCTPTQLYIHHFEKFQEHINNNEPEETLTATELHQLKQEFVQSKKKPHTETTDEEEEETMDTGIDTGDALPPGVDAADAPPDLQANEKLSEKEKATLNESQFVKRKAIQKRRDTFKINEEEVGKRWNFEEGIKRPYFHVKPLERAQLRNWREYLEFEIQNGDHQRTIFLFERCMIACALYEDMWLKYARYMETKGTNGSREVFERACTIHLKKKPNVNMAWAAYEERQGSYEEASKILLRVQEQIPDLLEATLRRINLERRQGNLEKVEQLYQECISQARSTPMASHFTIKLARYLYKVRKEYDKAKTFLVEAIKRDPTNSHLHMQLVDIGFQKPEIDEDGIIEGFNLALNSEMNEDEKIIFAQRKLEFLEDFGKDPVKIQEAFDDYSKFLKSHSAAGKKRQAESNEDLYKDKKTKGAEVNGTDSSSISTTSMSAHDAQTAAAYTYQQSWAGYPQAAYNYQQAWGAYPASYYQTQ